MRQKILLIISILILNSFVVAVAEEPPLPPLPELVSDEFKDLDHGAEKSFFQKIKEFFGFGEEKSPIKPEELNVLPNADEPITKSIKQGVGEGAKETIPVLDNNIDKNSEKTTNPSAIELNTLEDLKLPSGLQDDLDLPQIPKVDDKESLKNDKSTSISTEAPLSNSQLPSLSEDSVQVKEVPKIPSQLPSQTKDEIEKAIDPSKEKVQSAEPLAKTSDKLVDKNSAEKQVELPVPTYVTDSPAEEKNIETNISQPIAKETNKDSEKNASKDKKIKKPEAVAKESNAAPKVATPIADNSSDPEQVLFITNEAKLLLLPNDDVILGNLTETAYLEFIDFNSYVDFFWINYNKLIDDPKREAIDQFIAHYDEKFNDHLHLYSDYQENEALNDAFKAINKGDIYLLSALLRTYPILQLKDKNGNSLLHFASYDGNYPAARLLVYKGINISATNEKNQTALYIATKLKNKDIVYLLKNAQIK